MQERKLLPNIGNAIISCLFGIAMLILLVLQMGMTMNNRSVIEHVQQRQEENIKTINEMKDAQDKNKEEIQKNKEDINKIQQNSSTDTFNLVKVRTLNKTVERKI
jgi:predicted Holliday junction resolvase-like endonuclease